jgi:hypothetical protein
MKTSVKFQTVKASVEAASLAARLSEVFDDFVEPNLDPEHSVPLRRLLDLLLEQVPQPKRTTIKQRAAPSLLVTLPRIFAEDHTNNDYRTGYKVSERTNAITYRITDGETYDDWLSDSLHTKTTRELTKAAHLAHIALSRFRKAACVKFGHDFAVGARPGSCKRCQSWGLEK